MLKCETVTRADGSQCKLCFAADGTTSTTCPSGDATDAAVMSGGGMPADACKVIPRDDTRCGICSPPTMPATMACLKCQPPVKTTAMDDFCRTCAWSDMMGQCLQCFTASGTPTLDDCDALRSKAGP
jgi:hypothetical protein